jgi:DNA repair exonuclease SbcCD nuclease subunit
LSIRILHTADWQIGKQFANVPGDPGAALRLQRLETVRQIAELAAVREADLVLVAGDVFEDNGVSDDTLRRTVRAMAGFTGPWVLLPGNHDAGLAQSAWSRLRRLGVLPDNILIADSPDPLSLCDGRLEVLPAPLQRRHEARDVTAWFDQHRSAPGLIRIGLAHGSVLNRLPDSAALNNPISDQRAASAVLDYLALGDWHGTLNIAERTWYAGTPEQDRFRQNEPGQVLLVDIEASGAEPVVEPVSVGRYRWYQLTAELYDEAGLTLLASRFEQLGEPDRVLVRLRLSGSLNLALRQQLSELLETWQASFHFLQVEDAALLAQPSPEDIADMGATGFLREAVDRLVAIEADTEHPDQADAAMALQILYLERRES